MKLTEIVPETEQTVQNEQGMSVPIIEEKAPRFTEITSAPSNPMDPLAPEPAYKTPEIENLLSSREDFDTAMRASQGDLQWALRVTRGINPDKEALTRRLSEQAAIPRSVAESDAPFAEDVVQSKKILSVLTEQNEKGEYKHPGALSWLSDPRKMALAKDDVEALAGIERELRANREEHAGTVSNVWQAIKAGTVSTAASAARIPALAYGIIENKYNPAEPAPEVGPPAPQKISPTLQTLRDNFVTKYLDNLAEELKPIALNESAIDQIKQGEIKKAANNIFLQAVFNAPQMAALAAGAFTGASEVAVLGGMGVLTASQTFEENLKKGKEPGTALAGATAAGVAEGFFEKYTLGIFKGLGAQSAKTLGKQGAKEFALEFAKNVAGNGVTEGLSEGATQIAQDMADYMTGDSLTLSDAAANAINAALVGGLTGGIMTGAAVGLHGTAQQAAYKRESKRQSELERIATESKLRARSPEVFGEFMDHAITESGGGETIHVPLEAIQTFFQEDTKALGDMAKALGIEESIKNAETTGADVEIPRGKFITQFAGSELSKALTPDMRFSVQGMSENEQKTFVETQRKRLEEMRKEHAEIVGEEMPPQVKAIRETLMSSQGLSASDADAQVGLFMAGISAIARRTGETSAQAVARINPELQVGGEFVAPAAGEKTFLQAREVPAFYSNLAKMAEQKLPASASPAQILATLKEAKAEEVQYSGLKEFLAGKEKVAKADLLEFLASKQIQITETTLAKVEATKADSETLDRLAKEADDAEAQQRDFDEITKTERNALIATLVADAKEELLSKIKSETRGAITPEAKVKLIEEIKAESPSSDPTKYIDAIYSAREHYQEVKAKKEAFNLANEGVSALDKTKFGKYVEPGGANYREVLFSLPVQPMTFEEYAASYRKSAPGIDEATIKERYPEYLKDPGSDLSPSTFRGSHFKQPNLLFHLRLNDRVDAEGKKVLFVEEVQSDWHQAGREKGYKSGRNFDAELAQVHKEAEAFTSKGKDAPIELLDRASAIQDAKLKEQSGVVPDAPFKKSWQELGMKHALRMAVEGGYDKLAWTTGEQQAARYPRKEGTPEKVAQEKGMKGFYDKILPEFMNKYVKKWGGKVQDNSLKQIIKANREQGIEGYRVLGLDGDIKATGDTEAQARANAESFPGSVVLKPGESEIEKSALAHSLTITPEMQKAITEQGQPLFQQQEGQKPKGAVTFAKGKTIINLFESADLSTFLHESAHIFANEMDAFIKTGQADEQTKKDFQTLLDYAGGKFDTDGNEKIARAFEAYLREGKAPSLSLQEAFSRFRAWLTAIYKSIKDLTYQGKPVANLTPEVRQVFDRMLASEEQIKEAEFYYEARKSLSDLLPKVPEEKKADLEKKKAKATLSSVEKKTKQLMKAYLAAIGGRKAIVALAKGEMDALPIYQAIDDIRLEGGLDRDDLYEFNPEQISAIQKKHRGVIAKKKVDPRKTYRQAVIDAGGIKPGVMDKAQEAELRKALGPGIFRKDGYSLDQIAEGMVAAGELRVPDNRNSDDYLEELLHANEYMPDLYGESAIAELQGRASLEALASKHNFQSPEALFAALLNSEAKGNAVKTRTEEILRDREAALLAESQRQETVPGEESFHNDDRLTLLIAEMQLLETKLEKARPRRQQALEAKVFRDQARAEIGKTKARSAAQYARYSRAEQKYANQAYDLAQKGDFQGAHKAKNLQILNHAMVLESIEARDDLEAIEERYKSKKLKKQLEKTENEYNQAAQDLIGTYGLNATLQGSEGPLKLEELDAALAATMPAWVLNKELPKNFVNYKDLTVERLRELDDAIQSVIHVGRDELQSMKDKEFATVEEFVTQAGKSIAELQDAKIYKENALVDKQLKKINGLVNNATMMEFVFERLDNYKFEKTKEFGVHRRLFVRVSEASAREYSLKQDTMEGAKPHLKTLHQARKRLEKSFGGSEFQIPGVPVIEDMIKLGRNNWTVERMIAVVLNMGNEGNNLALQNGYGYSQAQLNHIASFFTKEELRAVQGVWDTIDSLYPALDAEHFKLYNRHLEKVEAKPITIKTQSGESVTLPGGYYPLQFDHQMNDVVAMRREDKLSQQADILANKNAGVFRKTKPTDGFTFSRTPGHSLPPELSLSVFYDHIADTARYITHASVLKDLHKITMNPEWRKMVRQKAGRQTYDEIRGWVQAQVMPEHVLVNEWEKLFQQQRNLATTAILGLNFTTGVKQLLSIFNGITEIGFSGVVDGIITANKGKGMFGMTKSEAWQKIESLSLYMKQRNSGMDESIRSAMHKLDPGVTQFSIAGHDFSVEDVRAFSFQWIQYMDRAAVVPVWMGAFNQSLNQNAALSEDERIEKAVTYADAVVRTTQASSASPDLNALMRSKGVLKLFTMFMTESFKYGNRLMHKYKAWREGGITSAQYFRYLIYEVVASPMAGALVTAILSQHKEPEWWEVAIAPAENSLQWIPVIRDIPRGIKYGKGKVSLGDSPMFEGINRAVTAFWSVKKGVAGEKEWAKVMWDVGRAVELQVGIPALNVVKEIEKNYNTITGKK